MKIEELFNNNNPDANIRRLGKQTIKYKNPPKIVGNMAVVGKKEAKGVFGEYFHKVYDNDKCGQKTFENAEKIMLTDAINGALNNANIDNKYLDVIFSGDLQNQIIAASYTARSFNSAFLGMYGACSSMAEGLILASAMIDAGFVNVVACATSSHFSTAERQYRGPLEYGSQKPPYAQWTVTGAGCSLLSSEGNAPKITHGIMGRVVDMGISDINNMGSAMAPAAAETLSTFFIESGMTNKDFDLIVTGDLGKLGSDILRKLMSDKGFNLGAEYSDCGAMIYDVDQKAYQGGSGCGCSAVILNGFIMDRLCKKQFNRVLFSATGALMSVVSSQQGETIPAICHAVVIEA